VETVTLHCCNNMWIKGPHPCARVRKALDEAGVPYAMEHHPTLKGRRSALREKSGQAKLPVIEFADGRIYREESKQMAAHIQAGTLAES
jgi:glutathione S-transferase